MFWDIVIIAGVFWIVMSIFSFLQTVQIRNIYKILEPAGKVYFGRDAGFLRTKYIAFAAVDNGGKVTDAKLLKASRIVTIPRVLPLDRIISEDLAALEPSLTGLDSRTELAVQNLSANYKKYRKQDRK